MLVKGATAWLNIHISKRHNTSESKEHNINRKVSRWMHTQHFLPLKWAFGLQVQIVKLTYKYEFEHTSYRIIQNGIWTKVNHISTTIVSIISYKLHQYLLSHVIFSANQTGYEKLIFLIKSAIISLAWSLSIQFMLTLWAMTHST